MEDNSIRSIEGLWVYYRCWTAPSWSSDSYQVRFGDDSWWDQLDKPSRENSRTLIKEHSLRWIEENCPMENASRFYDAFQNFSNSIDNGRYLCSAFLYNEYLAEERHENFGEFIAREEKSLGENLGSYRWRYHALTEAILAAHSTTDRPVFLYYRSLGSTTSGALYSPLKKRLEELCRDDMEILFDPKNAIHSVSVKGASRMIDDLLERSREGQKPLATRFAVESALFKLFARAVLESNLTETTGIALMSEKASKLIPKIAGQLTYDAIEDQDAGMFTTNEFLEFITHLEAHVAELGPRRLVTLLKLLHFPKLFGRGSTDDLRKLIIAFASGDHTLESLKAVIDVALYHDNALPTVKQWRSVIGDEILELASWELLLAFMGAEKPRKSYHLSKDQILFRRDFGA